MSDEDNECPVCLDELDATDRSFYPCVCGYQVCRFCWNRILTNLNGKCPACRTPYEEANYQFKPMEDPSRQKKKRERERERERDKKQQDIMARKHLTNVRVTQRNLVYLTNVPVAIAKEEILRKYEYFGQYGKILKIVVNKHKLYNTNHPQGPSVCSYITFSRKYDALLAIKAVNGFYLEGRPLRASFGTTKYCSYFLKGALCNNPDCMYLHELGSDTEGTTKDDGSASTKGSAVDVSTFDNEDLLAMA